MKRVIEPSIYEFPKWTEKDIQKIPARVISHKQGAYAKIKQIKKEERTFENTFFALEAAGYGVTHDIALLHILMNVAPKEKIRKATQLAIEKFEKDEINIEMDYKLYLSLVEYVNGAYIKEKKTLKKNEVKYIEDTIRNYKNLGFDLPKEKRDEFKKLSKKSAKLASAFSFNINATNTYILCTKEELTGLSSDFIDSLDVDSKTKKHIVTTQSQHYLPFMKLVVNSQKRKELGTLYLQKGGTTNIDILTKLTEVRHTTAVVLGYKNHIEKVLKERMAGDGKTASEFLKNLYKRVEIKSKEEMKTLSELKSKELGQKSKLEFYDMAFYSNKLYKKTAAVDTEYIKEFFETESTVQGMLDLYSSLFGLSFSFTKKLPVWNEQVKVLKITDTKTKEEIGYVYMDLFPRVGKYGHAMVTHATDGYSRVYSGAKYTMPICALVCNFTTPSKNNPSLLSLSDVETLFHEFGHALHIVLTTAELESQSGTRVSRDFVEAPSQMLENFVYNKENLQKISRHYKTGKSLDAKTIDKILVNKNFMMATFVSRQISLGLFDFAIHGRNTPKDIVSVYNNLYKKTTGCVLPKETYFPAGFGHMDGYDAGYYSYMWALVYAQDIYSKFESAKTKKELQRIGKEYRSKILEVGSSRPELESVTDFLGRKPNTKAFFASQGI